MYFTGIIIAVCTFLTIGIWHPIVIKTEYYWGTRPWVVYLVIGLTAIIAALFIENAILSAIVGVFGASGDLYKDREEAIGSMGYRRTLRTGKARRARLVS